MIATLVGQPLLTLDYPGMTLACQIGIGHWSHWLHICEFHGAKQIAHMSDCQHREKSFSSTNWGSFGTEPCGDKQTVRCGLSRLSTAKPSSFPPWRKNREGRVRTDSPLWSSDKLRIGSYIQRYH